jgi:hypothetical protein
MYRSLRFGGFIVLAVVLAGCATDGKLNTKGVVLKDGAPLKIGPDDSLRVILVPIPEDGGRPMTLYAGEFNADNSTFIVKGPDGHGMPPGKYRVAVEHMRARKDLFNGAFSTEKSPFIVTIQNSTDEITVDVGQAKK